MATKAGSSMQEGCLPVGEDSDHLLHVTIEPGVRHITLQQLPLGSCNSEVKQSYSRKEGDQPVVLQVCFCALKFEV